MIPRLFDPVLQSRYQHLVVSGCSFTSTDFGDRTHYWRTLQRCYNNLRESHWPDLLDPEDWNTLPAHIRRECQTRGLDYQYLTYVTWPQYLRDLLDIPNVIDTSASGAGNRHIHDATILALETRSDLQAQDTLVVVMWSGWDRDDFIAVPQAIHSANTDTYWYSDAAVCASTRGMGGDRNTVISLDAVQKIKDPYTRSLENFALVRSLRSYCEHRGFSTVFTQHSARADEQWFDPAQCLPLDLQPQWSSLFDIGCRLGDMAQDTIDGSHPTAQWHYTWTQAVLVSWLITKGMI